MHAVFSDLTKKGFFVTQGLKFGATFLAYEGDPLTCHARYLVHVSEAESSCIDTSTLLKCERLANSVAKDLLIGYRP